MPNSTNVIREFIPNKTVVDITREILAISTYHHQIINAKQYIMLVSSQNSVQTILILLEKVN